MSVLIRDVEICGRAGQDVIVRDGHVAEIGVGLSGADDLIEGRGGALIPGLVDHHIHLLATAARADSIPLEGARSLPDAARRISEAAAARPAGAWLRGVGYHEMAGELTRDILDRMAPDHPLRVQHQTGALWVLNSRALASVMAFDAPEGVERDPSGEPTGRIWRADAWLQQRIGRTPPPLAPLGSALATVGVTAVTDASASSDASAAALLADAHRSGAIGQRLTLMSARPLTAPEDGAFVVGPLKILLDDHDLPSLDDMLARIADARRQGRAVAVHCVTAGELALTLAAFGTAGAQRGDRIEHGGVIPPEAIEVIAGLGLWVVTQPGFIHARGDRYLARVDPDDHANLYRCASLLAAGVTVAASSDAPYGDLDPWAAIRAAVGRRTRGGAVIGPDERVAPDLALALFLRGPADLDRSPRRVVAGAPADLCLLKAPLAAVLADPRGDAVAATLIAGRLAYGD